MKKQINMIGGGIVAIFGLGLIAFGILAIFAPNKIEDLASYISEKTGILAEEDGIRGILEYVEGQTERRLSSEEGWYPVTRDEIIKSGTDIRTLENSKAVVTFEDGSVIRLNENSLMKFTSQRELILVEFSKGEIYNRVTKSNEREFAVSVGEYKIVALGTAFGVRKEKAEDPEVFVVESEIEIIDDKDDVLGTIVEGNKLKIDDGIVSVEKLTKDDLGEEFLAWNIKNDEEYFNKSLAETQVEEDEKQVVTEVVSKPQPVAYKPEPTKKIVEEEKLNDGYATAISLSGKEDGVKARLYWEIHGGKAPEGFKVVKSKQPNPVYPGDDYLYIKDPDDRSCVWKGFYKEKTYHFRICVYKKGKCVTYSNDVEIDFEGK